MPNFITVQEAKPRLTHVKRVLVIGCSGGGKSTLSQKLAKQLNLKYISYDRDVRWLPDWQERNRQEQVAIMRKLVCKDRWVMDGTSPSTFNIRLPRTDLVLWVRVPRYRAFLGLASRVIRYHGKTRPDMAEGCKEQLPDREFLSYIWNFEKRSASRVLKNIELFGPNVPVLILRSHREMAELTELQVSV